MTNILIKQSQHSITDCLKELKFSRPVKAQEKIDKLIEISESNHEYYPSRHKVGELVALDFFIGGKIKEAKIEGVTFTDSKVYYDIGIRVDKKNGYGTIIREVDSVFVKDLK